MINTLFWRLAGLSLTCSAVLLPLLLAWRFIRRRYSARTCYFLWLLLTLRLLLPLPAAQSRRAVTVEVPRYEIELSPVPSADTPTVPAKPQTPAQTGTAAPAPDSAKDAPARTVSLTALLPGLWLAGAVGCGLWLAVTYAVGRRGLMRKARPASLEDEVLLDALSQELGCKRRPALCRSSRVSSPMLMGLVRPVVVLPAGELPEEELCIMLRHELTHLRRHDVAYKLFLQLACIVHWFNPLVWWMSLEAGRSLELCCDEDVVRGRDKAFRRTYGNMLLKTAAGTGRTLVLSARMGGGKGYLKARLNNLFFQKKNSAALVCAALAAAILGGTLVSCTGEVPEESLDDDWKAVVTSFKSPEELQEELDRWELVLASFDNPDNPPMDEQLAKDLMEQTRQAVEKIKAEMYEALSIMDLEESIMVTRSGMVSFTIPENNLTNAEWQIEIRGRAEYDGIDGMSLHYDFDRAELKPGMRCSYNFAGEWSGVTDLYLSVTLGGHSKDIDLLAITPSDTAGIVAEEWMGELSERWYVRDEGGFGGDFYIHLKADGTFDYCVGLLSSHIGMGTWTCDGETLCLADEELKESAGIQYYYFKIDENALIFQAENSAEFMYVDMVDGERFSQRPIKPTYVAPDAE